jgi:hypothetical protein
MLTLTGKLKGKMKLPLKRKPRQTNLHRKQAADRAVSWSATTGAVVAAVPVRINPRQGSNERAGFLLPRKRALVSAGA